MALDNSEIEIVKHDDYTVINLKGSFSGGDDETENLRETFRKVSKEGETKVLVNLENVKFLASASLGALLSGNAIVRKKGGKIVLYNSNDYLDNIFSITKLSLALDIVKNKEEALKSFK